MKKTPVVAAFLHSEGVARGAVLAAAAVSALLLSACSSQPPTPDWQMTAQSSAQTATEAYLAGNTRIEQLEWDRARAEVARTGRPDLLARLELMRCAAQIASLETGPCERFEALRSDAAAPEKAYADYLAGRLAASDASLLPSVQRSVAASGDATSVAKMADPVSRLVAAGVLLQTGRASPQLITEAINTASAQGWRRPLMAWLGVQAQRADVAGDIEAVAALRRRIAIVEQSAPKR
jgi:outer membrane murein-binding lipoprotein Lpp